MKSVTRDTNISEGVWRGWKGGLSVQIDQFYPRSIAVNYDGAKFNGWVLFYETNKLCEESQQKLS